MTETLEVCYRYRFVPKKVSVVKSPIVNLFLIALVFATYDLNIRQLRRRHAMQVDNILQYVAGVSKPLIA